MQKLPSRLRRPSIVMILHAEKENPTLAKLLWQLRANRSTRYANQSTTSQPKRRKQLRRLHPHGH